MKVKYFIAISLLPFYMLSCKSGDSADMRPTAGKVVLVFRALQEEMSVHIYKPIDRMYNPNYITDKLDIKPNISISYELDVNGFAFVRCRFSNGKQGEYLMFPGDCVEINCESQGITVSGDNAEGHNYFNANYINRGLGYHLYIFRPFVADLVSDTVPINYESVYDVFQQELILPYQTDLKKMELSGSISPEFSSILAADLYIAMGFYVLSSGIYENNILSGSLPIRENFTPSGEDSLQILLQLNKLYETLYAMTDEVEKMHYNPIYYYLLKYRYYLDDEAKEKLTEGYDKDTFGNIPYYLLASDSLQLSYFGRDMINELQGITPFFNKYNPEKMLAFLSNKFPDSEYVAIIKTLMGQTQSTAADDGIVIMDDSPSSIREMMQISGIKGKYAYIDLWATWCTACIAEFRHNNEINELLAQYNHIVPVYISFDRDDDREVWKNGVKQFDLKGYNILSSSSLNEDIGIKVYNTKEVGFIPRFILLDSDGNVVNNALPRKSNITGLRSIFAGLPK